MICWILTGHCVRVSYMKAAHVWHPIGAYYKKKKKEKEQLRYSQFTSIRLNRCELLLNPRNCESQREIEKFVWRIWKTFSVLDCCCSSSVSKRDTSCFYFARSRAFPFNYNSFIHVVCLRTEKKCVICCFEIEMTTKKKQINPITLHGNRICA